MSPEPARLRAVVVDDEDLAREGLRRLLEDAPGVEVVGEAASGGEAVRVLEALRPDLVFLDVRMPELDGFEVLENVDIDPLPAVVFVTAYGEFALDAFDVHAVDYLLKPYDDERLREALERVRTRYAAERTEAYARHLVALLEEGKTGAVRPRGGTTGGRAGGAPPDRIAVRSGSRTVLVPLDAIDWIAAEGDYVRLHVGERSHLHDGTLGDLAVRLEPRGFLRIHRSTVVNLDRVREIHTDAKGERDVVLEDGTRLRVARSRREALEEALGG